MIKIENTEVVGWEHAIRGMRNPMNSFDKSDSEWWECDHADVYYPCANIGPNDLELMQKLCKAGTDHRKFMRMIVVYADITAPLYWWSEYDTYKVGTVANSCSKMHKLLSKPFEASDFSFDKLIGYKNEVKQFRPEVNEENECWVELAEYPGYFVSDCGRVRHNKRILSGSVHKDSYIFVNIQGKQIPIHRLVADCFVAVEEGKDVVNHIDGNKMNNAASNLEWCTQSENIQHSHDNNLQPKGLSTYKGKFSLEERQMIKDEWDGGNISKRKLAEKYGVSHTCICDIINDKYKYVDKVNVFEDVAKPLVDVLNELRDMYLTEEDVEKKKKIWYSILQLLPSSYNQKRTVMLNYEVLANIYKSRRNHKLDEWVEFCKIIETLPHSEFITQKFSEK